MSQICRRCLAWGVLLVLALASAVSAQTTGSIVGRVTDEQEGVLPGVTVEAGSPSLQGTRTAVTDETGTYRLTLLPPGIYTVAFTLSGFAADSEKDVAVGLDQDTVLNPVLRAAVAEEITVTTELPVVNITSTELGTNLDARSLQTLPTGRNYSSVVQIAPGVSSDANPENTGQSSITVYGSTGAENVFYVDGVNTTGVEYGFQGKELNFEFIEAVDVKTGGYEAELGRATGGIINVITKSGGNEFHGDVFGYYDSDSFQSSPKPVVATSGTVDAFTREDYGIDLGGYILKDRLWFFAAYDRAVRTKGQPTVLLVKTVKGYGMGEAGEGQNITHQQKKMAEDQLRAFRDRIARRVYTQVHRRLRPACADRLDLAEHVGERQQPQLLRQKYPARHGDVLRLPQRHADHGSQHVAERHAGEGPDADQQ